MAFLLLFATLAISHITDPPPLFTIPCVMTSADCPSSMTCTPTSVCSDGPSSSTPSPTPTARTCTCEEECGREERCVRKTGAGCGEPSRRCPGFCRGMGYRMRVMSFKERISWFVRTGSIDECNDFKDLRFCLRTLCIERWLRIEYYLLILPSLLSRQ